MGHVLGRESNKVGESVKNLKIGGVGNKVTRNGTLMTMVKFGV